jgi:hypothetical protein
MDNDNLPVNDDYVYELENTFWQIMFDCQDLILCKNTHDEVAFADAIKRIHRQVINWRGKTMYYMRSDKMNQPSEDTE